MDFFLHFNDYLDSPKIVTAVIILLGTLAIKWLSTRFLFKDERIRSRTATVELLDKIINERKWKKKENRILVEEMFEQIFSKPLSFCEIKILIDSRSPSVAFRTYLKYRPHLELNKKNTKFRYKKNMKPYFSRKYFGMRIHKSGPKGVLLYFIFSIPASTLMTFLLENKNHSEHLFNYYGLWFFDLLIWLMAITYLLVGVKYQGSEKEILENMKDKFELK